MRDQPTDSIQTPQWMIDAGFSPTLAQRFWPKVDKTTSPFGCWLWTGAISNRGYGFIGAKRIATGKMSNVCAHRLSWMMANGKPVPAGKDMLHRCPKGGNKICVNPAHLRPGTKHENTLEASFEYQKYQGQHWNNKLKPYEVEAIKKRFAQGGITKAAIAREFDINPSHVSRIISGNAFRNHKYFQTTVSGVEVPITCTGNTIITTMRQRL